MLKTKSLQFSKNYSDGLRVCVMRRIKPEYDFDIWFPKLSPSEPLLQAYILNKEISWEEFQVLFKKELFKNKKFLKLIAQIAVKQNVTLLCWEDIPDYCHRSLVAQACYKINSNLNLVIK